MLSAVIALALVSNSRVTSYLLRIEQTIAQCFLSSFLADFNLLISVCPQVASVDRRSFGILMIGVQWLTMKRASYEKEPTAEPAQAFS